ncbi:MAG TPA: hydantoinase B/oxoprolinase family protein, partial [Pyrodictium sp.]|nr:hydantoinase B/oxoprolinase family protein [Pyrodictium sp.]
SMASAVKEVIKSVEFEEGDTVILNDPYRGGTHLPDITLIAPLFHKGELLLFVANRAHHADVGGVSAGSMPLASSLFQEGIVIPPIKLIKGGKIEQDVLDFILSNVRTPKEREGDLLAQVMACKTGIRRLEELLGELGKERFLELCEELSAYGERLMKSALQKIPPGEYSFEDFLEDDGMGARDVAIRVEVKALSDRVVVDFSRSDPQVRGPMNAPRSVTLSATYYVFRCLLPEDSPAVEGCFRPIEVITRKGTVVDAIFPYPVSGGNVETSQRIVDVLLGALAKALPDTVPAASQGTMNNVAIGGIDLKRDKPFTYYETLGGGMGAWAGGDGESAVHSHMTNTMNTPVEALEHAYPFLVRECSVRRGSGGEGKKKGGDGIIREIEFLTDVEVTVLSERRRIPPYGLFGGKEGKVGRNVLVDEKGTHEMPGKFSVRVSKGTRLRIETPGGGGYA